MTQQPKTRITVVGHAYHQNQNEHPVVSSYGYTRELPGADEQVYGPRRMTLGPAWVPLDLGWLKDKPISLLTLEHYLTPTMVRLPPQEEEQREGVIIEISVCGGTTIYYPVFSLGVRETVTLPRPVMDRLRVRAVGSKSAKLNVTVFPG